MLLPHRATPLPASPVLRNGPRLRARIIIGILKILYITYWGMVGVALLFLPWREIWEDNYVLNLYPQIRPLVTNPFFKGAVLGLGIANILIGIREIVYFKHFSKGFFSQ